MMESLVQARSERKAAKAANTASAREFCEPIEIVIGGRDSKPTAAELSTGSPGSHAHADLRNWQPAATIEDYLRNCRDGLENYSGRRAAKILGMSRAEFWRMELMARLPDDLFELFMAVRPQPSSRALAQVAHMLAGDNKNADVETCPHCGEVLRMRHRVRPDLAQIVLDWLLEQRAFGFVTRDQAPIPLNECGAE